MTRAKLTTKKATEQDLNCGKLKSGFVDPSAGFVER
jgi:hypothetical protein